MRKWKKSWELNFLRNNWLLKLRTRTELVVNNNIGGGEEINYLTSRVIKDERNKKGIRERISQAEAAFNKIAQLSAEWYQLQELRFAVYGWEEKKLNRDWRLLSIIAIEGCSD